MCESLFVGSRWCWTWDSSRTICLNKDQHRLFQILDVSLPIETRVLKGDWFENQWQISHLRQLNLREREYSFAIMTVCQKGTMPIKAGDQTKQQKNTKVWMQWNAWVDLLCQIYDPTSYILLTEGCSEVWQIRDRVWVARKKTKVK